MDTQQVQLTLAEGVGLGTLSCNPALVHAGVPVRTHALLAAVTNLARAAVVTV